MTVVVPVRYPLTDHSRRTLDEAIRVADERNGSLTVLHVNLYHLGRTVSRPALRREVESEFGRLPNARYVVREGFLVEETLADEAVAEDADVVVLGQQSRGRFRRLLRRLGSDPDIETYLRTKLDAEVVTVES